MTELAHENAVKAKTDELASMLLDIDTNKVKKSAKNLAKVIKALQPKEQRIVITGAAGAGKSTTAKFIGEELKIPVFDLDQFIDGGWTKNREEYEHRLLGGMRKLLEKLPEGGWIVEHVEACHPSLVHAFEPNVAVFFKAPQDRLINVAQARSEASGSGDPGSRAMRAVTSGQTARSQFSEFPGKLLYVSAGELIKIV